MSNGRRDICDSISDWNVSHRNLSPCMVCNLFLYIFFSLLLSVFSSFRLNIIDALICAIFVPVANALRHTAHTHTHIYCVLQKRKEF